MSFLSALLTLIESAQPKSPASFLCTVFPLICRRR